MNKYTSEFETSLYVTICTYAYLKDDKRQSFDFNIFDIIKLAYFLKQRMMCFYLGLLHNYINNISSKRF